MDDGELDNHHQALSRSGRDLKAELAGRSSSTVTPVFTAEGIRRTLQASGATVLYLLGHSEASAGMVASGSPALYGRALAAWRPDRPDACLKLKAESSLSKATRLANAAFGRYGMRLDFC